MKSFKAVSIFAREECLFVDYKEIWRFGVCVADPC
jgi:hypothetical protein